MIFSRTYIRCDWPGCIMHEEIQNMVKENGWYSRGEKSFCPAHAKDAMEIDERRRQRGTRKEKRPIDQQGSGDGQHAEAP